jgi:cellulose synthase/poly-beta-1,6-N-acetylglucosamine synthase-like glycosyltransferase
VWLAPLLLGSFAGLAVLVEPNLRHVTTTYARFIEGLTPGVRSSLGKQASVAIRPLFALFLLLFGLAAAGPWRGRLKLILMTLGAYAAAVVPLDVLVAWAHRRWGWPSPFSASGNALAGVVGLCASSVALFSAVRLPADVTVRRTCKPDSVSRQNVVLASAITVGLVAALEQYARRPMQHVSRYVLLAGVGSPVLLGFVVFSSSLLLLGMLRRCYRPRSLTGRAFSVAFLVPARNEGHGVAECIAAIDRAAGTYPGQTRLYVVENGSSDDTLHIASIAVRHCSHAKGTVLQCLPKGKSHALNVALGASSEDIIVRVDADTLVAPDILDRIIPYFWDPQVGGVSGVPLPRESWSWLGRMRAIEVIYGVLFKRLGQSAADAITVLPGSMVAYRRPILVALNGFAEGMNGEDADITVRVGRLGYRIVADPWVRFHTEVPSTLGQLREQRMRWARGQFHMLGRNRSAIWTAQGVRGLFMLPWGCFQLFRKLMLAPFAVALVAMIMMTGTAFPLREVASAGAILLGLQLLLMGVVLGVVGAGGLVSSLPGYIVFRLMTVYFALETLLTLSLRSASDRELETVTAGG